MSRGRRRSQQKGSRKLAPPPVGDGMLTDAEGATGAGEGQSEQMRQQTEQTNAEKN